MCTNITEDISFFIERRSSLMVESVFHRTETNTNLHTHTHTHTHTFNIVSTAVRDNEL